MANMPTCGDAEGFHVPPIVEIRGWGKVKCVTKRLVLLYVREG